MKILNNMNRIHCNRVNSTVECNLLHDILKNSKITKNINSHYPPIINVCMNTHRGTAKFKIVESYWILKVVPLFC